jgi:quinol-cytochrome oxidoreductase complex cytochrome b subunit
VLLLLLLLLLLLKNYCFYYYIIITQMLYTALFSTLCVFVSFIRARSVIGPWAVESARK